MHETFVFDLDSTICETKGHDYIHSVPIPQMINKINKLHDEGNIIIIRTGRGASSGKNWFNFTLRQLKSWGLKFDSLLMDREKPECSWIVDNLNMSVKDFLEL